MIHIIKQYLLYLFRWQLSTPILALVLVWLSDFNVTLATIIANFIGGIIFFWVDRFIFTSPILVPQWEIKEQIQCVDCGIMSKGFRLVKTKNYDRTKDKNPEFRCDICSEKKTKELKSKGILI